MDESNLCRTTVGTRVCANSACNQQDPKLTVAPPHSKVYFGLQNSKKVYYFCQKCLEKSESFREECVRRMKENSSILEIPTHTNVGTVDLDVDLDTEDVPVHLSLSDEEITSLVQDLMISTNLESQTRSCNVTLTNGIKKLVDDYDQIEEELRSMEREVDQARALYYATIPVAFEKLKLKAVDIDQHGNAIMSNEKDQIQPSVSSTSAEKDKSQFRQPRKSIVGSRIADELRSLTKPNGSPKVQGEDVLEVQTVNNSSLYTNKCPLFETPAFIPKPELQAGNKVYAMKRTFYFEWDLGEVDKVFPSSTGETMFKIKFERKKGAKRCSEGERYTYKDLTLKQLAYNIPCPFILPVGQRVIGLFRDDEEDGEDAEEACSYYVGIVAEPPKHTNKYRYLIFFDDGYAQYVDPTKVLLVCSSSTPVWIDVHKNSQEFIKQYIQEYPERPMVRLAKDTVISTEWSGKWWETHVVEVDCSLAKMLFTSNNRYEWIYRGSTRLLPLYASEKRTAARSEKIALTPNTLRSLPRSNRRSNVTIEYLYGNEDVYQRNSKPVARKSTGGGSASQSTVLKASTVDFVEVSASSFTANQIQSILEFEGKITKIGIPSSVGQPEEFENHRCSSKCVIPYDQTNKDFKKVNPLAIILFLGWTREISKSLKKQIIYRAPCGRRLRDYKELHEFLLLTNFTLTIDHFVFDPTVDCLREFQAARILFSMKDISYGKEIKPVQAVNSLDHDYPEYVEYSSERVKGVDVPLELNPNFLVCCDCTDDCQDKLKCACWNLTFEGYKKTLDVTDVDKIGYSYRLLKEHTASGIYECNNRCKCRKTCLNKVVQNKMKWILQVFKTNSKGWAIRCLHDIPKGAFICQYAGQLLTEHGANEDGKNFGDEYLAELDFIEVCEKFKEGYEEHCIEPESDVADESDDSFRGQRQQYRDAIDRRGLVEIDLTNDDSYDGFATRRRQPSRFTVKPAKTETDKSSKTKAKVVPDLTTRDYYNKGEQCFIMDCKSIGNIGRYLNHSCCPNTFVQNVFVDTHDVRFPWIAFFAAKTIKAGTELTWDYNYEIGSVPGKKLYCQCGAPECRGRLL